MSGCEATPEVKRLIRGMAADLVESGRTDAMDLVDTIHDAIKEHTPLWKSEIADIISGYGEVRKPTQSELKSKLGALKKELRDDAKRVDGAASKDKTVNAGRSTRLKKQIAELESRLSSGDYGKAAKPPVTEYDAPTFDLLQRRNKLAQKVDAEIRKIGYQSQSAPARLASTVIALRRFIMFTSSHTLAKLSMMAMSRTVLTPAERAVASVARLIPGLRGIYDAAPVEGGGFNRHAELAALKGQFSRQTLKDTWDHLLTGSDSLTREQQGTYPSDHPVLDIPQHAHGAIKVNVVRNAYYRTVRTLSDFYRKQWAGEGMSTAEIDARLESPITQAMITAKAYAEGLRSISLQPNELTQWWNGMLRKGRNAGGFKAVAATAAEFEMPVVKVPTNLADEIMAFAGGSLRASPLIFNAIREGTAKLTPDEADYVARNLNKNGLGAAVMLTAYFAGPSIIGAFYQTGDNKKHPKPLDEGAVEIGGHEIPHYVLEHPLFTAMTIGATLRRVVTDEGKSEGDGLIAVMKGVGGGIPFLATIGDITSAARSAKAVQVFAGKQTAGLYTPPDLARYAKDSDPEETRKPQNFLDALKMGIPGLREQVATSDKAASVEARGGGRLEAFMAEHTNDHGGTPHSKRVHEVEDALRRGESPDMSDLTPKEQKAARKASELSALQIRFKRLSLTDKMSAWDKATPEERNLYTLADLIVPKSHRGQMALDEAIAKLPPAEQDAMREKIAQVRMGMKLTSRQSDPDRMRASYRNLLASKGMSQQQASEDTDRNAVHHIIPDNMVRHHPLMARAIGDGYDLDRPSNLIGLAKARSAATDSGAEIGHWTSHPKYDEKVLSELDAAKNQLESEYGSLDRVPKAKLMDAVRKIEDTMRGRIERHDVPTKGGRLATMGADASEVG